MHHQSKSTDEYCSACHTGEGRRSVDLTWAELPQFAFQLLELKALVTQAYSVHLISHYQYMIPQLLVAWVLVGLMPVAKVPSLALDEALRP